MHLNTALQKIVPLLVLGGTLSLPEARPQAMPTLTLSCGGWKAVFTQRGTSTTWDGIWTMGSTRVVTVMEGGIRGSQIQFQRTTSSDGHLCSFRGTLAADGKSASGVQTCAGFPDTPWSGMLTGMTAVAPPPVTTQVGTTFTLLSGGWTAVFIQRGASSTWDAVWTRSGDRVVTVMEGGIQGNQIYLKRTSSSDGHLCEYRGTISADGRTATGVQTCPGAPDFSWTATFGDGAQVIQPPPPPPPPGEIGLNGCWNQCSIHFFQEGENLFFSAIWVNPPDSVIPGLIVQKGIGSVHGRDVYLHDVIGPSSLLKGRGQHISEYYLKLSADGNQLTGYYTIDGQKGLNVGWSRDYK